MNFDEPNALDESGADTGSNAITITRHDGWTGDKMAKFCEVLAETAVVAEACEEAHMGIAGAYALRRRNAVFAAAWDASLTIARERLADTLLARSMEGNIEQIYRDGELVGERHVLDNRLGLAILRRLDRLAETGSTVSNRGEKFVTLNRHPQSPAICHPRVIDWDLAIGALRTGDDGLIAEALGMLKGHKVEEVEDPPLSLSQGDTNEDEGIDLSDRYWQSDELYGDELTWMTDFPPPAGFDGYKKREWGDPEYERECTPEEVAAIELGTKATRDTDLAEDEALRDAWFAMLREEPDGGDEAEPAPVPSHHPELTATSRHPELDSGSMNTAGTSPRTAVFMDPDLRQDDSDAVT